MSLAADVEDVRGLRENLDRSGPGIEGLEARLARTEGLIGDFEGRLTAHGEAFRTGLDRMEQLDFPASSPVEDPGRVEELAEEHRRAFENLRAEKDEEIAALTMQAEEHRGALAHATARTDEAEESKAARAREVEELRSVLEGHQARVAELEGMLVEREQGESLRIAHLSEELADLRRVSESRIEELETQNRLLGAAPDGLAARHEQELAQVMEQADRRVAEHAVRIRGLEASAADAEAKHEAQVRDLREKSDWKIQVLEERARLLEEERRSIEAESEAAREQAEARIEELTRNAWQGVEREGRIAELEGRIGELEGIRAELDVLHANEIARLKRSFRKRLTEVEQSGEGGGAPPSTPADTAALERVLHEKEAVLALLSRRNEELERQVEELARQAGTDGSGSEEWAPSPEASGVEAAPSPVDLLARERSERAAEIVRHDRADSDGAGEQTASDGTEPSP